MRIVAALAAVVLVLACASAPEKREKKKARRYDGPIIDMHAHYDASQPDAFDKNAADPRVFRVAALAPPPPAGNVAETRANNDRMIALAQRNAKVVPVGAVQPSDGKVAVDELDRLYQANVRAVVLTNVALDDPRTNDVVAKAGALGMLVMIESQNASDPGVVGKVLALAVKNPNARLLLAHMGLVDFTQLMAFEQAKRDPRVGYQNNVFFDLSSTAGLYQDSPYAEQLAWVVQRLGDRVVFGSEFPVDSSANAAEAVSRLPLSEAEAGGVLYTNSARLLGL